MTQPLSLNAVQKLISGDINACKALLALLEKEQAQLKERDIEALSQIIEEKAPLLSQLEQSAEVRSAWARSQNVQDVAQAWQSLLTQLDSEKLTEDWRRLKVLLQQCKEKNEVNGKMLIRNQKVFARLLDILRGQNTANDLYNATGAASGGVRTQVVAKA